MPEIVKHSIQMLHLMLFILYHLMKPRCLLLIIIVLFFSRASAQDHLPYIDISKISVQQMMADSEFVSAYINPGEKITSAYPTLSFRQGRIHKGFVPNNYVPKTLIIKFRIKNVLDSTVNAWFFPGIYFPKTTVYKDSAGTLIKLPSILPKNEDQIAYRKLTLKGHDSMTLVLEIKMLKTYLNKFSPRFIATSDLPYFITHFHATNSQTNMMSFIFCGLLLMMILYSVSMFLQGANPEFLYYSGYALFLGLLLFAKALYSFRTTPISFFQEEYLDFILQSAGHLFYLLFMKKFLATKVDHPGLHKLYNAGILLILVSVAAYTFLHYFTDYFALENAIENITKLLLLVIAIIFLVYSFRKWNDRLLRFLFWGNFWLFIFSLLSQAIIMFGAVTAYLPGVFRFSIFYYQVGLFLELVFFLAGLNYKNRKLLISQAQERERLKAENQMKEYEKEIAVFRAQQEERERISADMHDELGSGMTAIRLMSEIARNKMKEQTPVEIEKISSSADEVLNKMNAIIWSMNSGNDSVDNLISYIRSYALEYFENTPIDCKVSTPDSFEDKEITGDKRRNIFLCVKETLNNALKHSKATEIKIDFEINDVLQISISDNGKGIDMDRLRRFGNGLKNIKKRMENIGGSLSIESNNGTHTILTLPL